MRREISILVLVALIGCSDRQLVDDPVGDTSADDEAGGDGGGERCPYDPGSGEVVVLHEEPALAVDETGSIVVDECRVYWTMQEGEIGGEVFTMSHAGGESQRLATNLTFVHALALSTERLFFADQSGVHAAPINASAAALLLMPYEIYPIDVAADDQWVFVATPDGLLRMPVDGVDDDEGTWVLSTPASLVALADDSIYLRTTDALVAVDDESFDTTTLAPLSGDVWGMAVGEESIYLAKGDRITSVPRTGGDEQTFVAGGTKISTIAVDATRAYWSDFGSGTIYAAELASAEAIPLAVDVSPVGVAIDQHSVFWTTTQPGSVSRRAKP